MKTSSIIPILKTVLLVIANALASFTIALFAVNIFQFNNPRGIYEEKDVLILLQCIIIQNVLLLFLQKKKATIYLYVQVPINYLIIYEYVFLVY
ncbi:hypothetical protein AB9P05_04370 [Roseivirga sp. BDSF3-8]|uniref:hypothetical protein n=1 Tax=Roseivirga sp. BDSF3-8 TaxID=3241598 RepID=UPI0035320BDF